MDSRIGLLGLTMFTTMGAVAAQSQIQRTVWKADGNQPHAGFGGAVAAAGDVNGDGYADILVGAYAYDDDFQDEGSAAVFYGSPAGPSKVADWSAKGDAAYANFGETVAGAGDVNGDGHDDVIVGAPQAGRASVYLGSAAGLAPIPAWTAQSGVYTFGWSVSSAGDVNGDGYADVLLSELNYTNDKPYEGRVLLYPGSPSGPEESPAWIVEGNQGYSSFGAWVTTAGDVNGDGYADVLVGAPRWNNGQNDEGRAFAYLGSSAGLASSPAWTVESDQAAAFLGYWLAPAGDVNGDGYADVAIGANSYSNGEFYEGRFFVYQGSPTGLSLAPSWTTESNQFGALGGGVSSGDFDGDGYSDVLVGYYAYDGDQTNEGAAFVFFGSPAGLATGTSWFAEGNQRDSMFGFAVSGAGDVNGDGFDDVLVGAYEFDSGQRNEGRAFAYLGSSRRRL